MLNRLFAAAFALLCSLGLHAQSVPLDTEAKFLKVLLTTTGQFGLACNDQALSKKLEEMGVSVGPGFKLAWGSSEPEVRALKAQERFVICPNLEWLKAGASMAIVEEDGHPQLYLQSANAKASGMAVPDAISKISKKG
jgi:hypothetical protein